MNHFQPAIVLSVFVAMPILSMAQQDELTMQVIESLDDVKVHHRIQLPDHIVAKDSTPEKVLINRSERDAKSDQYKIKREEINVLIAAKKDKETHSGAGHNKDKETAGKINKSPDFQETIVGYRKEIIERRQQIIDDLREKKPAVSSAAAAASFADQ